MIAAEVAQTLSIAGAETISPDVTVGDATRLIAIEHWIDGALLDANLGGAPVRSVMDCLTARGTPTLLATGYDIRVVPKAYARLHCRGPSCGSDLVRDVARAMVETPCQ